MQKIDLEFRLLHQNQVFYQILSQMFHYKHLFLWILENKETNLRHVYFCFCR
ncbi:hypothetical protein BD408DRAFT_37069 [Parasitella parasitica]|nr:hypothetical protein BD408DRAFT_37069 [Parasitella parasitica]